MAAPSGASSPASPRRARDGRSPDHPTVSRPVYELLRLRTRGGERRRLTRSLVVREVEVRFLSFRGRRVAYAVSGDGPALVVPAWWVSHLELNWRDRAFRSFWAAVGEGRTLVRYDGPGVGMSDRDGQPQERTLETEIALRAVRAAAAGGGERRDRGGAAGADLPLRRPRRAGAGARADAGGASPLRPRDPAIRRRWPRQAMRGGRRQAYGRRHEHRQREGTANFGSLDAGVRSRIRLRPVGERARRDARAPPRAAEACARADGRAGKRNRPEPPALSRRPRRADPDRAERGDGRPPRTQAASQQADGARARCVRRAAAVRRPLGRHRRLDLGAVHRGRARSRVAGDRPGAASRRPTAVHRARPFRVAAARRLAGPPRRALAAIRRGVSLQPRDRRADRGGRARGRRRARGVMARRAADRPAARLGPCTPAL